MKRSFSISNLQVMPCSICNGEGHNKRTCTPKVFVKLEVGNYVTVKLEVGKKEKEKEKPKKDIDISNILTFFSCCKRGENDSTNKIRENIIKVLSNPPKLYLEDSEYGKYWSLVHKEYTRSVELISEGIPFTSSEISILGGRKYNYDFDLNYYKNDTIVATRKIEFKNGGTNISKLPQFLSLSTKCELFETSYEQFWYNNYLDKYIQCDTGITLKKPELKDYLKKVCTINYNSHPFFLQLKNREHINKLEKHTIVNESIADYLTKFGKTVNIDFFKKKIKDSQEGKIFLMWCNTTHNFYTDTFLESEKNGITYHSIKNGNVIQLQSGNTMYHLLLRWRNHKGILNPAWQISMKRES